MPSWVLGVALAGVAGVINAGGVIIQKRAHVANAKLPEEQRACSLTTVITINSSV